MKDTLLLITGVSRGLGQALAADAATRAHVQVLGIHRGVDAQGAALLDRHSVIQHVADLSDAEFAAQLGPLERHLKGPYRRLFFVNNASVIAPLARLGTHETDPLIAALHVNVIAPTLLLDRVLALRAGRELTLIDITSGAARHAIPGWGPYCVGKAATQMLFRVARAENPDVKLYEIDPGVVDTDMQAAIRTATPDVFPDVERFRAYRSEGQLESPADVAARILETVGL